MAEMIAFERSTHAEEAPTQVQPPRNHAAKRSDFISQPRISFSIRNPNDPEPEIEGHPWLTLRGTLFEPIRDVHEIVFKLWPDPDKRVGPARPAAVGYIMNIRPEVEVIANFAPSHFDYIWSLALS